MAKHCPWCGKELEGAASVSREAPGGICDECAQRLHLVRTLWQFSARPEEFRIVVISRAHATLYESLRRALGGFSNIGFVIDRRFGDRRTLPTPVKMNRRSGHDRRHPRKDLLLV